MDRLPDCPDKPCMLDRVVPLFLVMYAVWTVYVHAITATEASFDTLMRWLPLILSLAILLAWHWLKQPPIPSRGQVPAAIAGQARAFFNPFLILSLSVAWTTLLVVGRHYDLFWWGSVVALGAAWISSLDANSVPGRQALLAREPCDGRSLLIVLAVALAAACVTLIANRPDADDAFYQSIPATLLRLPGQPVLVHDTIYRFASLPIQLPVYRMHSYEVLVAVLARATGIGPAVIAYMVLPPLFAVLSVIAWTQLLRLLAPKQWSATLVILFLCVLMLGEAHHSYGNFAFVRMFQGKAILATCIVPVIVSLAIEYSRRGTSRSWAGLLAAQIAAIGITSSGLFVAPAAAGFALVGAWSPNAVATRRLFLGILASVYLFVVATAIASITHGGEGFVSSAPMPPMLSLLDQTFGSWSTALLLVALLASWSFAEGPALARQLAAGSLCFLLTVLNPYTCQFVADHLTGTSTYWRLSWALPLPFLLAIVLCNLMQRGARIKPKAIAFVACSLLAAGVAVFFQHAGSLRKDNFVSLGMPGLKVPALDYSLAKNLADTMPENGTILAPESVATWLPTFIAHPVLLSARGMYLVGAFGQDDGNRRLGLQMYVEGWQRAPDAPTALDKALDRYALTAVVVTRAVPWRMEIAQVLSGRGWHRMTQGPYDIWTRTASSALAPR